MVLETPGHLGGCVLLCSADKMLDGQRQRVDIIAFAIRNGLTMPASSFLHQKKRENKKRISAEFSLSRDLIKKKKKLTTVSSPWDFSHGKFGLLSLGKAC